MFHYLFIFFVAIAIVIILPIALLAVAYVWFVLWCLVQEIVRHKKGE